MGKVYIRGANPDGEDYYLGMDGRWHTKIGASLWTPEAAETKIHNMLVVHNSRHDPDEEFVRPYTEGVK